MTTFRRLAAHGGHWAFLGALTLVLGFLLAAAPRTANRIQDQALHRTLAAAPYPVRDLMFSADVPTRSPDPEPRPTAADLLAEAGHALPVPLPATVGDRWAVTRTQRVALSGPGVTTAPAGRSPKITLLGHDGLAGAVRLVEGTAPHNRDHPAVTEVMLADAAARDLGLHTGGDYEIFPYFGPPLRIRVSGLFAATDPAAPVWAPYPTLLHAATFTEGPAGDPVQRRTASLLTDVAGLAPLREDPVPWGLGDELWFRLADRRVTTGDTAPLRAAVARLRTTRPVPRLTLHTRLDDLLTDFTAQATAVRALLAVVFVDATVTGLGLLLIGARLAVDRRRAELALLRARGGTVARIAGRLGVEAALVLLPAAALGWLAGRAVPGRPPDAVFGTGWTPPLVTLGALAAVPVAAAVAHRRVTAVVAREDPGRGWGRPVRWTVEATVVLLAAVGVVLARRRGLAQAGVDPYLVAVPVLAGVATGLLAVRLLPYPTGLVTRLAARGRGAVAFVGLARAGRTPARAALPLVVLVFAVAGGGFAGAVRAGVDRARDLAAVRLVGGDLRLSAAAFATDVAGRVAAVPGVSAVASGYLAAPEKLRTAGGAAAPPDVAVLVLDVAAYRQVLRRSGVDPTLPAALAAAGPAGPVPAVVSAGLAHEPDLTLDLGGVRPLRRVATLDALPGLPRTGFVVVPRSAFPGVDGRVSVLYVAGRGADPAAVRAAARAQEDATPDDPAGPGPATAAATDLDGIALLDRAGQRRALDRSGFNGGIALAFGVGAVAALVAGVGAVVLALLADAAARGRTLSLLRTLGLRAGPARGLLLAELAPWLTTALLAGAALGVVLPGLLAPALGLSRFAAGTPVPVDLDAPTLGALVGLLVLLTATAVLVEAAVNRRSGLGTVLRVE